MNDGYRRRPWRMRVDQPSSIVLGRTSKILFERFELRALMLTALAKDPELYDQLLSMLEDAQEYDGAAVGTPVEESSAQAQESKVIVQDTMTVAQAAAYLKNKPRAVVAAIHRERLPAEKVGSQWLLKRVDVEHYGRTKAN